MGWSARRARRAVEEAAEAVTNLAWVMTVATRHRGVNLVSFRDALDTLENVERQWSRIPIAYR
jgi:hypothetical protein